MYDAIVVGARCAGSSTARLLAQRGQRVLMVDRAEFPSDTVSTHCITTGGVVMLKRWGLLDRVLATGVELLPDVTLTIGPDELVNPLPVPDGLGAVSPRRTVLDKLLVDAAAEEGVEVREGVTFRDLLWDGDRVVGVVAEDAAGERFEERAQVVIGADGARSAVAEAAGAEEYDARPSRGSGYYAYFSGMPMDRVELAFNGGCFAAVFPTNDGQACVVGVRDDAEFGSFRDDVDAGHAAAVAAANARLGECLHGARRESRFFAFRGVPGFFRRSWGPGWALVGDAGYYKDPVTGHGITDAFRDAELLADALASGLGGDRPLAEALAGYQEQRDSIAREVYEVTQDIAGLEWDDAGLLMLFMRFGAAVQAETDLLAARAAVA
jgi:flavin-dependent dehydrogenase